MTTLQDIQTWRGRTLHDARHDKIGEITEIYLDRRSGEPEWMTVKTGLLGRKVTFVPMRGAHAVEDRVVASVSKAAVKDAPSIDADGELSPEEERRLYAHYGMDFGDFDYGRDYGPTETTGTTGPDVGEAERRFTREGRGAGQADDAMTRSEEEIDVRTRQRATGRARLRKVVVTDTVERTVPVQREEVRIEREPITDANRDAAMAGPEISEAEHEVTLHEEEPVVERRVEPKERVRLGKDKVTEERTISEDVRKERIDTETDNREERT